MKKALLAVSVVAVLSGCDAMCKKDKDSAPVAASAPAAAATPCPAAPEAGAALAKINGREITDADVRQAAGPKLQQAEMDLYDARKDAIDGIIDDQLIDDAAKKDGIAKADYLKKNVFDK